MVAALLVTRLPCMVLGDNGPPECARCHEACRQEDVRTCGAGPRNAYGVVHLVCATVPLGAGGGRGRHRFAVGVVVSEVHTAHDVTTNASKAAGGVRAWPSLVRRSRTRSRTRGDDAKATTMSAFAYLAVSLIEIIGSLTAAPGQRREAGSIRAHGG